MNFTICRVFLFILGAFGQIVVLYVYLKSRPVYGPEPGYRQRDKVLIAFLVDS